MKLALVYARLQVVELARFVQEGGTLVTEGMKVPPKSLVMGSPGKVKRLRHSSRAQVAPSGMRGDVRGPWWDATARIVTEPRVIERAHAALVFDGAVRNHGMSLNRFVELTSTAPAKLFGLFPRKGTIAVGSDADIVVFDPEKKVTISAKTQHSKTDYNLYEGTEVTGTPEVVLLRGQILVEGDELVAEPGIGQFVRRAKFGEELKPARAAVV